MIKKCPTCGSDKIKDKLTCPDCGYQIEETDQHTNEENESITQSQENSSVEVFPDSELNDPIEWSELKDLPLESVMEIFKNDGNTEENNQSQTVVNPNDKENEENPMDSVKELNKQDSTKEQTLEKAINAEQKKRVAELKEFVDQEEENSILAAYIKAHREDTTEEHAKELLKMIDEKITSKENPSFNQERVEKTDSSIGKTDKQEKLEPIEPVSLMEEKVPLPTADSTKEQNENIIEEEKVEETQLSSIKSDQTTSDQEREAASLLKETAKTDKEENKRSNEQLAPTAAATIENEKGNEEPTSSSTEEHKDSETANQTKKSKKVPYMVLVAVLLLGAGGWAYYDHQQNVQAQIAAEEAKQQKKVNELKKTLAAFYVDDAHQFLQTAMINQDLSKLRTSLDGVKEEKGYADLEKTYEDIQTKVKSIKGVNELFTAEAIIDDHLADDLKLKTDQEIKRVETDESDFGQLLKKAQDEAVAQYDQLQSAKEKTKVVYADNKVSESATREQYTDAEKAVEQVKNQDLVTTLKDQLNQVDKGLTEKEKKEEQQKKEEEEKQAAAAKQAAEAAEAARKAQAAAQAQASQQASASASSTNKNPANQPIMSTRQSDVADTANAAWNWAPGVQEKVINTCIQRGYIVQGGYRLERVRIENGEGYYNLYATSTKSALMNGIGESALPFYIVTINCKTGWFGGNGSR